MQVSSRRIPWALRRLWALPLLLLALAGLPSAAHAQAFQVLFQFTNQPPATTVAGQPFSVVVNGFFSNGAGHFNDVGDTVTIRMIDGNSNPTDTLSGTGTTNGAGTTTTLTGTTDSNGNLTFSSLTVSRPGLYSLQVTSTNGGTGASNEFTVTAPPTPAASFTNPPTAATSGVGFDLVVHAQKSGSTVTGANVALALSETTVGDTNSSLSGTFTAPTPTIVSNQDGSIDATFTNVVVHGQGSLTLTATVTDTNGDVFNQPTAPLAVTRSLTVTYTTPPPASVVSGQTLTPAVVVNVVDAGDGSAVSGIPVALGLNVPSNNSVTSPNTPALSGTGTTPGTGTTTATSGTTGADGSLTFTGLSVNDAGTGYALAATADTGQADSRNQFSTPFNVTPAQTIAFSASPTSTPSGQPINGAGGVVVHVANAADGTPASGFSVTLALNPQNGEAGTLSGTTTGTTDANGNATFQNLSVNVVGSYALTATAADSAGTPLSVSSTPPFTVTPGAAATLTFTQQPASAPLGLALDTGTSTPGVMVQVTDAAGNVIPGQAITVALSSANAGTLTGTTTQMADANGVATFQDLKVSAIGRGYTLTATAGAASQISSLFDIVADPALIVTSTQDDGGIGTLRTILGIATGNPPGTTVPIVTFDPTVFTESVNTQTITLLGGEIDVPQSVTVTGPTNSVNVSGNNQSRVFGITGGTVAFSNVNAMNGFAPNDGAPFFGNGGGVAVSGGNVTLTNSNFSGNQDTAGSGNGGAIYNAGALTLVGCTVGAFFGPGGGNANTAAGDGGGVFNDVGGMLTLTGGTSFFQNSAGNDGGAIRNDGVLTFAPATTNTANRGFFLFNGFVNNHANNHGGAVSNTGSFAATGGVIVSNGASDGGGVYNAGGQVGLADVTISGNGGNDGGGVYSAGGAVALVGCAVTSNGATNGGGVYNAGSTLTLTSDTFTQNSSGSGNGGGGGIIIIPLEAAPRGGSGNGGSGGGLFTVGGTATLTDDVFYGDTNNLSGGVSEIAGRVRATFCDIQGITPDGSGNFSADPQFTGGGNFGPSVQISGTSPVIGRGTTNAPFFRSTDLNGSPYLSPPAIGATEELLQNTHVLWTNPNGRTIFWNTDAQGRFAVAGNYAPFTGPNNSTGYVARALSTGFNGVSHILWSTANGYVSLWDVNSDGTHTDSFYGPFSDDGTARTIWQPVAVSTDGNNGTTHLLWNNPNGRTILWDVRTSDQTGQAGTAPFTVVGNYDGFSDDGTAATTWKGVALASGPDGLSHILWNNASGKTLLWNLDGASDQPANSGGPGTVSASQNNTSTAFTYPLQADDGTLNTVWTARAASVDQYNVPRLLWNNPNGRTILWNVNPSDGTFAITGNYPAPQDPSGQGGFTAVALATGSDNRSHLAFNNPNGETYLWDLLNDGGPNGSGGNATVMPFFYGIFSDDGTANTSWKAVAISAAQAVNSD